MEGLYLMLLSPVWQSGLLSVGNLNQAYKDGLKVVSPISSVSIPPAIKRFVKAPLLALQNHTVQLLSCLFVVVVRWLKPNSRFKVANTTASTGIRTSRFGLFWGHFTVIAGPCREQAASLGARSDFVFGAGAVWSAEPSPAVAAFRARAGHAGFHLH